MIAWRRLAAVTAALAWLWALPLGAAPPRDPPMPGPAPARHAGAAAENARCEGCHTEIAAEWRGSLHRRAHTDPAYQRALAVEPLAFCRGCHAPEADPARDPPRDLGEMGVGCVSCHSAPGGVLARPRDEGGAPASAPHALVRSEAFATAAACASCHEFSFPDAERRSASTLMQATASEHAGSPFSSASCASCHMPAASGPGSRKHRSHAFAASRDPALLRAALAVQATRLASGDVEVRLSPKGVGHAFPTGDLFRRLEILVEAVGPEHNVVASDVRHLARRFGRGAGAGGHPVKVMVADTRVAAGADARVRLSPGAGAAGLPIAWRVAYQRVEHPLGAEPGAAVVEGEVEIARGLLPP